MAQPLLKPRWLVGHVLAVAAVVVFVLLGLWQLRRHDEKVELRDVVAAAVAQDPVDIAGTPDGEFVRVSVRGSYDVAFQQRVPRSRDGVSGYAVIAPLLLDGGGAVLALRGWVGLDEPVPDPPPSIAGEGVLWPGETGSVPDEFGEFSARIDPAAVNEFTPYALRSAYLVLTHQDPDFAMSAPEVGSVGFGPHLGYAGQWFLFAAVVAIGYPILLRKRSGLASTRE